MDRMGLSRENILAYTMPGFATSDLTLGNAHRLMRALDVKAAEIDIKPPCRQMFRDIGHPYAEGKPVYDVTFENVQAGERTSHLFRLANLHNGLVLGTGDLSELALGWMTYGVGDHMSHYNVNVSVPKTLIPHLIRWVVSSAQFDTETGVVLRSILETEISPELVPHSEGDSSKPAQKSSETVGPYELQDFNLYYISRYGFRPSKVAFLSHHAWSDKTQGSGRTCCRLKTSRIRFADHQEVVGGLSLPFFQTSQFKRSALPNGPKVGSGDRCRRAAIGVPETPSRQSGCGSYRKTCPVRMVEWTLSCERHDICLMNTPPNNSTSRREFLKSTGRIAAASALAGVALPHVHAAVDDTVQLALVGCGGRGTGAAANAFSTSKLGPVKLVAMADVFQNRLKGSYDGLNKRYSSQMDVPVDRQFIGVDAYQKPWIV